MAASSTERSRLHRARKAAAIEALEHPVLRDAAELLAPAVEETLMELGLGEQDQAAAQLARRYAAVIDGARDPAWALRWIGPLLQDCLTSLQATPASRKAQPPVKPVPTALDRLRQAHAANTRPSGL
jgi:hypothetical protein